MTDTNQTYKRLTKKLVGTRKTLQEVCRDAGIDIDDIDDGILEQHCCECAHCGIWGRDHKLDEDEFFVCKVCFSVLGY
jgi:hypothetical protein